MSVPRDTYWALPRLRLADLPSPLQRLDRFSELIGAEVWIKRDDVGEVALAGNKVRKLEFELAAALDRGDERVVTVGAAQSNHCRATAAACARLGLGCTLALAGEAPTHPEGNLLIDELVGARIVFAGTDDWAALAARAEQEAGAGVALLPAGCSTPLGAVGFLAAYEELTAQLHDMAGRPDLEAIYHASSSGATHAGLLLGAALAAGIEIRGVAVAKGIHADDEAAIAGLAREAASLLGLAPALTRDDVRLLEGFMGADYGMPTPEAIEAIALLARSEAIVADPVYSGKALAALVADARAGRLRAPVLFWHTGGWHAWFTERYAPLSESPR